MQLSNYQLKESKSEPEYITKAKGDLQELEVSPKEVQNLIQQPV